MSGYWGDKAPFDHAVVIRSTAPELETLDYLRSFGGIGSELASLLTRWNGLYAYDAAVIVRPSTSAGELLGVVEWNDPALWKVEYQDDALSETLMFAEDVFGYQFAIRNNQVAFMDVEAQDWKILGDSLQMWMEWVSDAPDRNVGSRLARDYAERGISLTGGIRLVPKKPFVLGGSYADENLSVMRDVDAMRFRGRLARELRDVPDGGIVELKVSSQE